MTPMSMRYATGTDEEREQAVSAATRALRAGEVVVLPTDTVYGIAADAFDAAAVRRLLAAKGRGRDMPPPVLINSPGTIDALATRVEDLRAQGLAIVYVTHLLAEVERLADAVTVLRDGRVTHTATGVHHRQDLVRAITGADGGL